VQLLELYSFQSRAVDKDNLAFVFDCKLMYLQWIF